MLDSISFSFSELGSSDEGQTKATEILLLHDSVNPEWTLGPDFPDFIAGANIVATSDQRNLIVIGKETCLTVYLSSIQINSCRW